MTWTKLGIEFWEEMAADELSDAAVRTHGEAIGWLYQVERGSCMVPKSKVYKVTNSPDNHMAVRELVRAGYWREHDSAFEVVHHGPILRQSLAAQDAKRDRDAKAQQRWTARAHGSAFPVTGPVTGPDPGPATAQTDSHTTSRYEEESQIPPQRTDETPAWPPVRAVPDTVDVDQARGSWRHAARGYDD